MNWHASEGASIPEACYNSSYGSYATESPSNKMATQLENFHHSLELADSKERAVSSWEDRLALKSDKKLRKLWKKIDKKIEKVEKYMDIRFLLRKLSSSRKLLTFTVVTCFLILPALPILLPIVGSVCQDKL